MSRKNKIISTLCALLLLLGVWEGAALLVNKPFVFPDLLSVLRVLCTLAITGEFWQNVCFSFGRILLGFLIGALFGILFGVLAHSIPPISSFLSLVLTVIKSTPVASFILVLWVLIGSGPVPIVIALFMVMPTVYANTISGLENTDPRAEEMADVFCMDRKKRFLYIQLPSLITYLIPSVITGVGLSWKAGIAAEIIAYTKNSIGREIYLSKVNFDAPALFAWTLTVIFLSLILEFSVKKLGEAVLKKCHLN